METYLTGFILDAAAEEKTVKRWESEFESSRELVTYAYERTVSLISKPSLAYMSKILESWHNDGINTAEKAEELLEKQGQLAKKKSADEKAEMTEKARKAGFDFDFEDIFEKP